MYEPLAIGDSWKYTCNHQFAIENRVIGTTSVRGQRVFEFQLQIPSTPAHSIQEVQLLANDSLGRTKIYGYLAHGKVKTIPVKAIVVPLPKLNAQYDYAGPNGKAVSRIFVGFENTNPTPLGTFWVTPYFESGGTHNYGYTLGKGIMEEDHGPHYEYDCLIERIVVR